MAYLFDTDAIVEVLRARPRPDFLEWLRHIPRADQFITAITIADLSAAACRSKDRDRQLAGIGNVLLPAVTVLPFDAAAALVYGGLEAAGAGQQLTEAELQIASIALLHDLELVTGNGGSFATVAGLRISPVLDFR